MKLRVYRKNKKTNKSIFITICFYFIRKLFEFSFFFYFFYRLEKLESNTILEIIQMFFISYMNEHLND